MSESIIQTHTSSLLEEGGQRRIGGREGKRERGELKMGRGRDRKENVSWAPYQSICYHEDESKYDMGAILCFLRGHFKFTYREGWSSFKMVPLSPGSKLDCIFKQLVFILCL